MVAHDGMQSHCGILASNMRKYSIAECSASFLRDKTAIAHHRIQIQIYEEELKPKPVILNTSHKQVNNWKMVGEYSNVTTCAALLIVKEHTCAIRL
jgi:hypothetical protein